MHPLFPQVEHPVCPGTLTGLGAGFGVGLGAVPQTIGLGFGLLGLVYGELFLGLVYCDKAFLPVLFSRLLTSTDFGFGDFGIFGFGLLGLFGAFGEPGFLKSHECSISIDGLSLWGTLGPLGLFTPGTWLGFGIFGILMPTFGGFGTDFLGLWGWSPSQGGGGGT